MAPLNRKRPRPPADEDDLELVAAERANSSLRHEGGKKTRVSEIRSATKSRQTEAEDGVVQEQEDDGDGDGDDLDHDHDASDVEQHDYETQRDAGFDDLLDEDLDTQRAAEIIQQRNLRTMDNLPAENGVVESVTCINFMCHSKLHVPLGPLINFIIGHNGSGKSAILTALTLCLGGKATSTNRGQSLKSFIKEGQESATLIVKIKNTGDSSYQPETYGRSITVERHFNKTGASSFKLKSATGRSISTKKADLEEICDYFALQIDNPMNVLTQDMARQFLNSSTPQDKYRFFVKGVQLEQLDQDYHLLYDTIDQIEAKLQTRESDVQILEERARKAVAKHQRSERQQGSREKLRHYQRQMAWAQVEQQEKMLDDFDGNIRGSLARIDQAEGKAASADREYDQANQVAEQAKSDLQQRQENLAPMVDARMQVKEQFDANKHELLSVQTQQRTIRDHLKNAEARISTAHQDIAAENRRLEEANGENHTRRLAALEEARGKVTEVKIQYDDNRHTLPQLEAELRDAQQKAAAAMQPIEIKRTELKQCENIIQTLQRDRGEHLGAFHDKMPHLLRAIRNESNFRERPVGPVGNHVRLLKPLWSSILEKSFGATLSSFIVTSKQDQALLSNLMRRMDCVCPILIGNNHSIDTSRSEPDPQFDTSMRVLEIDNDLVKRQLIINQGIEQTILIESREDASSTMYDGPRLRNVKQCFCLNEQRRGWGIRLGYGRGNEPSSAPMQPMTGKPRMKTDVESQISFQQESRRQLMEDLKQLQNRQRQLDASKTACERAIDRHKKQQKELHLRMQRAEDLAEKLQDELERSSVEDGRLAALKDGLREAEEEKKIHEDSYGNAVNQKDQLNAVSSKLRKQLELAELEIREHKTRVKEAEQEVLTFSNARQIALQEKNQAFQLIADAKEDKAQIERQRERQAQKVSQWTEEATKVCQRVNVDAGETPESLDAKLEKLLNDLQRVERELGGTREAIAQEAADTKSAADTARKQVQDLSDLAQMLKYALVDRQDRWRKFQRFISARARAQFTYLLSERSFRGSIKTDHKRRILDLQVEPDDTKSGKGRQTKTLSGGEKSFSTICLLLSLWEAMGSPIRCLDEFDVFMDNVNRDVSLKMMIIAARRSVGRQYILITPQSMGNVDVAGDVRITKLSDPERGQTTLPFST